MSGVATTASKSSQSALHLGRELLAADQVGAGLLGLLDLFAGGEDGDPRRATGAVGQHDRAPDHLVGVLRVDAQAHRDVDGLVELGVRQLLDLGEGVVQGDRLAAVDVLRRLAVVLSVSRHVI